jgi:hypothetical protein
MVAAAPGGVVMKRRMKAPMVRLLGIAPFAVAVALALAPAPASAALHAKGYETGDLVCGSTTHTVIATGFGAAFRVVDTTGVLVFRSGTLTNVATGDTASFSSHGAAEGVTQIRCTGILVNPVYDTTYQVEFFMSVVPG